MNRTKVSCIKAGERWDFLKYQAAQYLRACLLSFNVCEALNTCWFVRGAWGALSPCGRSLGAGLLLHSSVFHAQSSTLPAQECSVRVPLHGAIEPNQTKLKPPGMQGWLLLHLPPFVLLACMEILVISPQELCPPAQMPGIAPRPLGSSDYSQFRPLYFHLE